MHLFLRRRRRLIHLQRRRRRLFHLQQRHRQLALPWQHPRQLVLLCHGRRLLLTLRLPRPSQILIMALTLLPINSVENTFNVNSVHIQ
jgi:hypothetical protein